MTPRSSAGDACSPFSQPQAVTSHPTEAARFQQKQMQEKEQKLLRLYESQTQRAFQRVGRGSAGSSSSSVSSTSSTLGAGKVRQLFHERRQQQNGLKTAGSGPTGWDRSYPLEPLDTTTKQRLQASKSTGNLKAVRGTSLERNYTNNITTSNHYQVRNQARRSKSQVRSNNYIVADLGGSFRQQQLYDDDDDVIDYPQNLQPRHYRDVQNNRIGLERDQRESEFLHEQRIYDKYEDEDYDIEDEDPPFQQLDDDVDDLSDSSRVFQKLPNVGGRLLMETKTSSNNNVDRYKTYSATSNGTRASGSRLTPPVVKEPLQRRREPLDAAPVAKPKTTVAPKKPDAKVSTTHSSPGNLSQPKSAALRKPESVNQNNSTGADSASMWGKKQGPASGQVPQQTPSRGPAARGPAMKGIPGNQASNDLTECRICGRHFASDRIATHQEICTKTTKKKRKVFDPVKQRVKGTEAEAFLKKGRPQAVTTVKKTNWRQKHEDFINSIRAAKEMKAHVARGGKLSDLPPPPPSDYSDYVQCPHCSRRFNQQAAERHIPKCANFEFNKPKPQQAGRSTPNKGAVPRKRQ
ncbi:hypothetical protein Cfor_03904 [Coptotermes formosanus]|uniref:C2HC/C3H-type domain-containing protein n=1 Tax=Coptotermes formosanus TaxID=36987 RepID=A0A6L2QA03_COPFO|nr:hypothetical protein Cfor_03904 [Coptotermes formosanus]